MLSFKIDEDIVIREFDSGDAEAIFDEVILNYDHLRRFMHWMTPNYSLASAQEFLRHSSEIRSTRKGLNFGVFKAGKFIGSVGFVSFDWISMKTEIGYWISRSEEGKGTVTKVAERLLRFAFDDLNLNRVEIRCSSENVRSSAVARRLGFVKEGVLRQAEMRNGRMHDFEIYGLLKSEWAGRQAGT